MSASDPAPDNASISASLWHDMRLAALGTIEKDGTPHVSMVTASPLDDGTAILLLSDLARHTVNIRRGERCSLLVAGSAASDPDQNADPLAMERITVHGSIKPLGQDQGEKHKAVFLKHHPAAAQYIDFTDFSLYGFQPLKVFLVGGFGRIEIFAAEILAKNRK